MTVITRGDGTPFVIQAYRESLIAHKRSVLLQEIRMLAEQQGQYSRLFKQNNHLEAVFSQEPGYLLAESVWHYFNEPDNLIYCEALSNSSHMLLVVVNEGNVYLDTRISSSALRDELVPLMTGEQAFKIITFGELPLRNADSFGGATFTFPKKLVDSFESLDEPVFNKLPSLPQFQLQPLNLSLKSEYLRRRPTLAATVLCALLLVLGAWWLFSPSKSPQPVVRPVNHVQQVSPFEQYDMVLQSVAPDQQLNELTMKLTQLYLVPGWHVVHLQSDGKHYVFQMAAEGGDLEMLSQWSQQHGYQFHLMSSGPQLQVDSQLTSRQRPQQVYPLQATVLRIVDRLNLLLRNDKSVEIGDTQYYGQTKRTQLTVTLSNISPELLDLVGQTLKNSPIVLSRVDFNVDSGFISGTIQLSVWGS